MPPYDPTLVNAYRSERLVYRAVENDDDDKAFIHEYIFTDPVAMAMTTGKPLVPHAKEAVPAWIERARKSLLTMLICLPPAPADDEAEDGEVPASAEESEAKPKPKPKPKPIGVISLFSMRGEGQDHHRSSTIGLIIGTPWRKNRYGGEAINWVLDWGFRRQGLHRISISAFSYNPNAVKLYRSLGFVQEGVQRESLYYERTWQDIVDMSMLEHEWARLRGLE